ncbi:MAG: hypothetical protein GKS06_12275 [Acidobacteria bacterium]|nr:hypothetical protein [Acidobacteriota bacterium]
MQDAWLYARLNPEDVFAKLHHYSLTVPQGEREIEYVITVHEYGPAEQESRRFVARADKQTNQRTAAYTPCGWGSTLLDALSRCVREIHRFPYEGDEDRPLGALEVNENSIPAE